MTNWLKICLEKKLLNKFLKFFSSRNDILTEHISHENHAPSVSGALNAPSIAFDCSDAAVILKQIN